MESFSNLDDKYNLFKEILRKYIVTIVNIKFDFISKRGKTQLQFKYNKYFQL